MKAIDEVYALYFAMLILEAYQSTPFHLSVNQIKQIHQMKKVLQFEAHQQHHVSRFLDKILKSILNESTCKIQYVKNDQKKSCHVQFFKISAKFGQWYAAGIELNTNKYRVFRCDRITGIKEEVQETTKKAPCRRICEGALFGERLPRIN
ncbi:WYL domain-containing protein [Paenibacillus thiaminolyticus]|nr:WYL domain-containing protein [Paenibacillus thiaminolyticus]